MWTLVTLSNPEMLSEYYNSITNQEDSHSSFHTNPDCRQLKKNYLQFQNDIKEQSLRKAVDKKIQGEFSFLLSIKLKETLKLEFTSEECIVSSYDITLDDNAFLERKEIDNLIKLINEMRIKYKDLGSSF